MTREIQSADQRKKAIAYFDVELDDAGLDPYAFRAYCRIARRAAGHDSGACTESVENMAKNCQVSRPTMVRALAALIRRRMIQRIQRQGFTSVYVLLDKSSWVPLVNDRTTPSDQPGKGESQEPVKERTTPGKPQNHPLVNHRTTKKTKEENKEGNKGRKQSGDKSPALPKTPAKPKSPYHKHPAVEAYRDLLNYRTINTTQAELIAQATGISSTEAPADWRAYLSGCAAMGVKYPHNVQVIVLGFKHWKRGLTTTAALGQAWDELRGQEAKPNGNGNGHHRSNGYDPAAVQAEAIRKFEAQHGPGSAGPVIPAPADFVEGEILDDTF